MQIAKVPPTIFPKSLAPALPAHIVTAKFVDVAPKVRMYGCNRAIYACKLASHHELTAWQSWAVPVCRSMRSAHLNINEINGVRDPTRAPDLTQLLRWLYLAVKVGS